MMWLQKLSSSWFHLREILSQMRTLFAVSSQTRSICGIQCIYIQVSSQMNEQQLDSEEADLVEDTKFGGEED